MFEVPNIKDMEREILKILYLLLHDYWIQRTITVIGFTYSPRNFNTWLIDELKSFLTELTVPASCLMDLLSLARMMYIHGGKNLNVYV